MSEEEKEEKKVKRTFIPFTKEIQDSIIFSLQQITNKLVELENRIILLEKKDE